MGQPYRDNQKVDMLKDSRLITAFNLTLGVMAIGFFLGGAIGTTIGLKTTPSQPSAPPCRDSFEWIADRCDEPLKHTCESNQKMEVKDESGIHYMLCRCKGSSK